MALVLSVFGVAHAADEATPAIAGTWKGVYFVYPSLMAVEIDLRADEGGALSGELRFHPAVVERNAFGQGKGSYAVSGRFDGTTRTFLLRPGAWIEQSPMGGARLPIAGVLDARSSELAAIFQNPSAPNPTFFVLAAGAAGDELIAAVTRTGAPSPPNPASAGRERQREQIRRMEQVLERMSQMPQRPNDRTLEVMRRQIEARKAALGGDEGSEWEAPPADKLLAWAGRFRHEMPSMSLQATNFEVLFKAARNLFEDSWFKQCFGMTYPEMTADQRATVHRAFGEAAMQGQSELHDYAMFLGRPFQVIGDFGPGDITVSVFWQRAMRSWLRDFPGVCAGLPATRDSFGHLTEAESVAGAGLAFLWPGEQRGFATTLGDARSRLAGPMLTAEADQLITGAAGNAGARQLAGWAALEKDYLRYLAPADRAQLQQRVDARLDALLEELVAADVARLAELGGGLAGVEAGNAWYRQFTHAYDFALNHAAVQRGLAKLREVRPRALAAAQTAILKEVDVAGSEAQVEAVLASVLACPGDNDTEAAAAIRDHAGRRRAAIHEKEMLAMFSDYERSLMDRPGHIDVRRAGSRPPNAEEIRLALLRGMAFGTGKLIDAHTARRGGLLGAAGVIVRIDSVEVVPLGPPAPKGAVAMVEDGRYYMKYHIQMHLSLPTDDPLWNVDPNFRRGAQMGLDLANSSSALLSEEDNYEEFELYSDGWGVPDLRQQGAANAGLDALVKTFTTRRR